MAIERASSIAASELPLQVIISPKSAASEAFRVLRTNVNFFGVDKPLKVVQMTSATASEGKTTTVANLAVTMAQDGKRVVLIDADLRRPVIHRLFRVSNINGLISYLLDSSVRTEDVVIPVKGVENLWVIPSGPLPPNPSEALGSRRMHDLIEDLRTKYDFVIIDSAPVLGMADATVLAGQVDGTLMVVRSGTVVRDAAIAAKDQLMASKGRLLGVVLNGVGVAPGGYYYYYDSNNHERKRKHRHSY